MDWKTFFTIGGTFMVASLGATLAFIYNKRLAERNDRLDRINRQLSDFYGPLLALVSASESASVEFRTRYRRGMSYWSQSPPPTEEEAAIWRAWIGGNFIPLCRRMMEVIVSKSDLLDEDSMPDCLLSLCAHVASYEPILKQWDSGDFSENKSFLPFPRPTLGQYVAESFARLKKRQASLLRLTAPGVVPAGAVRTPPRKSISVPRSRISVPYKRLPGYSPATPGAVAGIVG